MWDADTASSPSGASELGAIFCLNFVFQNLQRRWGGQGETTYPENAKTYA